MNGLKLSQNEFGECFLNSHKIDFETYKELQKILNQSETNKLKYIILNHNYTQYSHNNGLQCGSCGCFTVKAYSVNKLLNRVISNILESFEQE